MGFDFDSMEGGGEEDVGYEGGARKRSTPPPPPPQHSDEKVLKFFITCAFVDYFFNFLSMQPVSQSINSHITLYFSPL